VELYYSIDFTASHWVYLFILGLPDTESPSVIPVAHQILKEH